MDTPSRNVLSSECFSSVLFYHSFAFIIHAYILNNRQKLMAHPSYDPTGQLSSSCLKTLWNRSHKSIEQERRNVCKFPLSPASLTQTAAHRAALASHKGHIQTRSRSTSKRNNTGKTLTSHQASAWESSGWNYRAGIIRVTSHREEFPFFTSECYSSFQCPSLNLKNIKATKLSHHSFGETHAPTYTS